MTSSQRITMATLTHATNNSQLRVEYAPSATARTIDNFVRVSSACIDVNIVECLKLTSSHTSVRSLAKAYRPNSRETPETNTSDRQARTSHRRRPINRTMPASSRPKLNPSPEQSTPSRRHACQVVTLNSSSRNNNGNVSVKFSRTIENIFPVNLEILIEKSSSVVEKLQCF